MINYLLIIGSILVGIICPVVINRYITFKKDKKYRAHNHFKSELDNLIIEKSIALEAIDKINQSFNAQRINEHEKDKLLLKYNKLLDHYNDQILKVKPSVDIKEMYEFRNQIYTFISDTISRLDKKLAELPDHPTTNNQVNQNKKEKRIHPTADIFQEKLASKEQDKKKKRFKFTNLFLKYKEKLKGEEEEKEILSTDSNHLNHSNNKKDTPDREYENVSLTRREEEEEEEASSDGGLREIGSNEVNKIHKEVLNILQRLENHSKNGIV